MTTRRQPLRCTVVAALLLLAGCSGDPTGPPSVLDRLAGTWTGEAFTVTSNADAAQVLDLVALGGTLTLAIGPSGSFSGSALLPGGLFGAPGLITIPLSGVIRIVDATTLRIDFVPEVLPVFTAFTTTFVLDEHTLTLQDGGSSWDFDEDGENEPATLSGRFRRN